MFQKLFTANQIKEIDNQTIIKQQIRSDALMERAATALFQQILPDIDKAQSIHIFCGKGNNGGDALVLARLLYLHDYKVKCYVVPFSPKASKDFKINTEKLQRINFMLEKFNPDNLPAIAENDLIIEGIFGTGLSRPASGIAQKAIDFINRQKAEVWSIDIPSGLYADRSNSANDAIVKANRTFSFEFPKISFFFPENAIYVPDFEIVPIGLEKSVIQSMPTSYFLLTGQIKQWLKPRNKFAYKNIFGHALIIGGSYGMMGAPVLSSLAALRIGAGLVTNFIPKTGYIISQSIAPEVMTLTDEKKKYISKIVVPEKITAVGIGMGMGQKNTTQKAFKNFLQTIKKPLLLDADALNILAQNKHWFKYVPENSILTPHEGEFKRLVGNWENDMEKWQKLQNLAADLKAVVVLKGAYTTVSDGQYFYINPVANAALATAGSGDVLSGIITGLLVLAQQYQPLEAALLGVYLHSQTAEKYVQDYPDFSMIARDIIEGLKQ